MEPDAMGIALGFLSVLEPPSPPRSGSSPYPKVPEELARQVSEGNRPKSTAI
jgi:hypothetical protein